MMIGIGTPNSQSNIPPPMFASMNARSNDESRTRFALVALPGGTGRAIKNDRRKF
jgi:hypothetical protein